MESSKERSRNGLLASSGLFERSSLSSSKFIKNQYSSFPSSLETKFDNDHDNYKYNPLSIQGQQIKNIMLEEEERLRFQTNCKSNNYKINNRIVNFLFHFSGIYLKSINNLASKQDKNLPQRDTSGYYYYYCNNKSKLIPQCNNGHHVVRTKDYAQVLDCDTLKPLNSFFLFDKHSFSWFNIKLTQFIHIYTTFMTIKIFLVTILSFYHESLKNESYNLLLNRFSVRNNNTFGLESFPKLAKCFILDKNEQLILKNFNSEKNYKLDLITDCLTFLGDLMISIGETKTSIYGIVSMIPILYYFWPIFYLKTNDIKMNCFKFLLNPIKRVESLYNSLNHLINMMIYSTSYYLSPITNVKSILDKPLYYEVINDFELSKKYYKHFQLNYFNKKKIIYHSKSMSILDRNLKLDLKDVTFDLEVWEKIKRLLFKQLLLELKASKDSHLIGYNSNNHKILLSLYRRIILILLTISTVSAAFVVTIMTIFELYSRAKLRIDSIKCSNWNKQAHYLEYSSYLRQLNNYDKLAYANNLEDIFYLTFFVELKYYFKPETIYATFDAFIYFWICSIFLATYASSLILSTTYKVTFLNDIMKQLNDITIFITEFTNDYSRKQECFELKLNKNQKAIDDKNNYDEIIIMTLKFVEKKLSIIHVNFILFRLEQSNHQKWINFLESQAGILVLYALGISYLTGFTVKVGHGPLILIAISYLLISMNMYILVGTMVTYRVGKIINRMSNLVSICSASPFKFSFLVELLRKQIIVEEEDIRSLFAVNIFGLKLSYEHLCSLNALGIGLVLILWRQSFQNKMFDS